MFFLIQKDSANLFHLNFETWMRILLDFMKNQIGFIFGLPSCSCKYLLRVIKSLSFKSFCSLWFFSFLKEMGCIKFLRQVEHFCPNRCLSFLDCLQSYLKFEKTICDHLANIALCLWGFLLKKLILELVFIKVSLSCSWWCLLQYLIIPFVFSSHCFLMLFALNLFFTMADDYSQQIQVE